MKKLAIIVLACFSLSAFAQSTGPFSGILNRFTDPDKGSTVFIEKGNRAIGITGGYRSFGAAGDKTGDGYAILSMLNIGDGRFAMFNASPSFSYFVADDLSLGVRLDYSGYVLDTDIRLDLRDIVGVDSAFDDDPEMKAEVSELLNLRISGRHMARNAWGASTSLRKYLSFFGSKTFAVFGEARLYGVYGIVNSCPLDRDTREQVTSKLRTSTVWSAGLKFGGGLCIRLRDNSAFTIGIPIIGASYSYTRQHKTKSGSDAHMAQFNISRDIDFMAVQVGYTHYIKSKKK